MTAPALSPAVPLSSRGAEVRSTIDGSRFYGGDGTYSAELLHSVTTVIGASYSKPWLTPWAAKLAAEFAVTQHDLVTKTLEAAGEQAAIDLIKGAAARRRDEASDRGTLVHDVVEGWILGALPDHSDDPEVQPYALAFLQWLIDWDPEFIATEATVASPRNGWAGTLDLILRFPRWPSLGTWLVDVKTGANLDWSMPIQLGTYAAADEVWLPMGQKAAMPHVDRCAVLHLRPEGAKLVDVTEHVPGAHDLFLDMLRTLVAREALPAKPGRVIYPPLPDGSQPPPLLEDLEGVPGCSALIRGGIKRLDQLLAARAEELNGLEGIGPKSVLGIRDFLAAAGHDTAHLEDACDEIIAKAAKAEARKAAKAAG